MRIPKLCLFTFAIIILVLAGCGPKPEKRKLNEVIPVKVAKVELKELDQYIDYVGNIKAQDEAQVYPKVSGKIIEKIKQDGNPVNKGEVIIYIDRDEVGLKFQKAPVESPLSGVVGRVYVDIGENVDPQTPVALVVNMDKVKIDLDIPENYLPKVSLAQQAIVSVDAYPDQEYQGSVTKISPVLDLASRTAPIEITIDNPGHLLSSGMFAKVKLIFQKRKDVLVILKEAIIGKELEPHVFIIKDNKAYLKKITLGIRQGPYYEVKEGLEAGDYVVIMGQQRLSEGTEVKTEE
ncbi:efflux RND transporter periplasmic adaptor subunit [bacterium]|nr:MAG: efflux RND transporter periplasmic adaptor subunit [bacterium]